MKTIAELAAETGEPMEYAEQLAGRSVRYAFIEFTSDCLGGCWFGKYGLLCLDDDLQYFGSRLQTAEQLDTQQRQQYPEDRVKWSDGQPTVERPWGLRLYGNDDSTWGIWFSTREAAEAAFEELTAFEPWEYGTCMSKYPWVYTN